MKPQTNDNYKGRGPNSYTLFPELQVLARSVPFLDWTSYKATESGLF